MAHNNDEPTTNAGVVHNGLEVDRSSRNSQQNFGNMGAHNCETEEHTKLKVFESYSLPNEETLTPNRQMTCEEYKQLYVSVFALSSYGTAGECYLSRFADTALKALKSSSCDLRVLPIVLRMLKGRCSIDRDVTHKEAFASAEELTKEINYQHLLHESRHRACEDLYEMVMKMRVHDIPIKIALGVLCASALAGRLPHCPNNYVEAGAQLVCLNQPDTYFRYRRQEIFKRFSNIKIKNHPDGAVVALPRWLRMLKNLYLCLGLLITLCVTIYGCLKRPYPIDGISDGLKIFGFLALLLQIFGYVVNGTKSGYREILEGNAVLSNSQDVERWICNSDINSLKCALAVGAVNSDWLDPSGSCYAKVKGTGKIQLSRGLSLGLYISMGYLTDGTFVYYNGAETGTFITCSETEYHVNDEFPDTDVSWTHKRDIVAGES